MTTTIEENPFTETIERLPEVKPCKFRPIKGTRKKRIQEREERKVERVEFKEQKRQAIPLLVGDDGIVPIANWWRENPVIFIKEILGIDLWSLQGEIAESVRDNARTSVRSASAVGKTAVAACIVLWFLCSFRPATVLTTGRSFRQVKEQLWREIRSKHSQSKIPIGGEITQTSLTLAEDWFAIGFSTDEPDRITGFHNDHILVIIDEGSGVPDEVYGAIDNPLSAGFTRLLLLGNPTQSVGKFRDSFTGPLYKSFHISAFDTPNFTGEKECPYLISRDYAEQKKREWGEDSPLYEVYIKGEFPSGESDRLIPFSLAEMATNRTIKPDKEDKIAIGVDLSRMGEDESVLYIRQGGKVIQWKTWRRAKTEECIGLIAREINWVKKMFDRLPQVNVDEGYNPGVVDGLKADGYKINAIKFGGGARDNKRFANLRAEIFQHLADEFKAETIQIPNDKILLKQVTDIKYKYPTRVDALVIESKEEMKARGLKSPDRADALALCFMEPASREPSIRWI